MKTIWNILMGHAAGAANRGTKHQFIGLTPLSDWHLWTQGLGHVFVFLGLSGKSRLG